MVPCHHKMHFCNNPPPKNLLTQRDAQCKWPINIENHEQVCISNMHRFRSQQKWCWESRKGSKITGSCSFSGEFSDRDPVFLPFTHCGEFRTKKKCKEKSCFFSPNASSDDITWMPCRGGGIALHIYPKRPI